MPTRIPAAVGNHSCFFTFYRHLLMTMIPKINFSLYLWKKKYFERLIIVKYECSLPDIRKCMSPRTLRAGAFNIR